MQVDPQITRLQTRFDAGPPAAELDLELRVVCANRRARALFGEEITGRALAEWVSTEADRKRIRALTCEILESGRAEADLTAEVACGGSSRWVEIHLVRLEDAAGIGLLAFFRPAPDVHVALLARTSHHLVLHEGDGAEAVLGLFADLADTLEFEVHWRFALGDDVLLLASSSGLTPEARAAFACVRFGEALCGRVAATREPLIVEDARRSPLAELVQDCVDGAECYIGVPLLAQGVLLGTVGFATARRRWLRAGELQVIEAVCDQAAIQLARAASERAARERAQFLELAVHNNLATTFEWDIVRDRVRRLHGPTGGRSEQPYGFADVVATVHPDDRARFEAAVADALASADGHYRSEIRMVEPGGEYRWISDRGLVEFVTVGGERRPVRLIGLSVDITEQMATRDELRERDQLLGLALRAGNLGIWDWDIAEDRLTLDEAFVGMLGHPRVPTRLDRATVDGWVHPDDLGRVRELARQHLEGHSPLIEYDKRLRRADGEWTHVHARGQVVQRRSDGTPTRAVGIVADLTASRRAAMALEQAELRLSTLLAATPLGVGVVDRDLRYVQVNEGLAAMNRVPAEAHLGRTARDILDPLGADIVEARFRAVLESGEALLDDEVAFRAGGQWLAFVTQFLPIRDPQTGDVTHVSCLVTDVSRRMQMEERLRASEARFRNLFEHAATGIAITTSDGHILQCNRQLCALLGYSAEELSGRTLCGLVHPEDGEARQAIAALTAGERPFVQTECRLVRSCGAVIWAQLVAAALPDEAGEGESWMALVTSIDQRRQEQRDLAFIADLTDEVALASNPREAATAATRRIRRRFEGTTACFADLQPDEDTLISLLNSGTPGLRLSVAARPDLARDLQAGRRVIVEDLASNPRVTDAARARWSAGSLVLVPHTVGGRVRFLLILHDPAARQWSDEDLAMLDQVTVRLHLWVERIRAVEALREEARRKDEFLAMLAHELRNPLAPIRNALYLLGRGGPEGETSRRAVGIVERQVSHLVRLVDDLLDVSRVSRGKITLERGPVDLVAVSRQAIETSRGLLEARRHTWTLVAPDAAIWVDGDGVRLLQVVGNLLNNAAKYTDEGGRVQVEVRADGAEAVVQVSDNGRGIDRAALGSVFDLFFQADRNLDRAEGGLGIGLSLVKSLVDLHDGRVIAHSEGRGLGSTFSVHLPRVEPAPPPAPPAADEVAGPAPLRILVVDDLPDAAESLVMLLEVDGHHVLVTHDGRSAVDLAARERPDVVLLDIGLPVLDGYGACREMREQGLDALVVAISGYGRAEDRERSRASGFDAHLVKPLDVEVLRELILRRALERVSGADLDPG